MAAVWRESSNVAGSFVGKGPRCCDGGSGICRKHNIASRFAGITVSSNDGDFIIRGTASFVLSRNTVEGDRHKIGTTAEKSLTRDYNRGALTTIGRLHTVDHTFIKLSPPISLGDNCAGIGRDHNIAFSGTAGIDHNNDLLVGGRGDGSNVSVGKGDGDITGTTAKKVGTFNCDNSIALTLCRRD